MQSYNVDLKKLHTAKPFENNKDKDKTMSIEDIIDKRNHDLGGGFLVGRVLPFRKRRMVGSFTFWDHMGPLELALGIPRELDVKPHPHIGLSTVTYLYSGAITHRDSLGYEQEIRPGAVNWMTAGSGITHSERLEYARANGANMHGIQAWLALPNGMEEIAPSFTHHSADSLPVWQSEGVNARLIAGELDGIRSPAQTLSPLFFLHLDMQQGARYQLAPEYSERAIYVTSGSVTVNNHTLNTGQMAILEAGKPITISANTLSIVMCLGGEPIGERYILWNFVSSSKERLRAAAHDWKTGQMKLPDADNQEWIAMPEGWTV